MNAQEGRPSSHEVGARQSTRTTGHITTTSAFAHGSAVSTSSHRRWHRGRRHVKATLFATVTLTALAAVVIVGGIVADHIPAWAMAAGILGVFTVGICVLARDGGR